MSGWVRLRVMAARTVRVFNPEALTAIRIAAGLSRPQLADAAGVDRSQLYRIERGEHRPYERTIGKLARALGIPVAALMTTYAEAGDAA